MASTDWLTVSAVSMENGVHRNLYDGYGQETQTFFSVPSPHMFDYAPIEYGQGDTQEKGIVLPMEQRQVAGSGPYGWEGQWSGSAPLDRYPLQQMTASDNNANTNGLFPINNMYPGKLDYASEMERMVALARQLNISGVLRDRADQSMPHRQPVQSPRKPISVPRSNPSPPSSHNHGRSRNYSLPLEGNHGRNQCGASWRSHSPVFMNGRMQRDHGQRNPYAPSGHDYSAGGDRVPVNPYADHQTSGDYAGRNGSHHLHSPPRNGRYNRPGLRNLSNFGHLRQSGPLAKPTPNVDFFESLNTQESQTSMACYRQQDLSVVSTFGEAGQQNGQFNMPQGLCLGLNDEIIVADTLSHRIQIFDKKGNFKFCWGNSGVKRGQLWHPRKVAFIPKTEHIVVSDRVNGCSRIQIFDRTGVYINTLGNLHQLRMALNTTTAGLTVYNDQVIVVEVQPPACVILNEDGNVHHWFPLDNVMVEPSDVVVIKDKYYISDFRGHCVCVFSTWGKPLQRLGGSNQEGIIRFPRGLGLTPNGNLLVADTDLNRFHVSVWSSDTGDMVSYHALLDNKVSHSCGIVMNQDGELITAVKKDHMVLVMRIQDGNSLYSRKSIAHAGLNVDAPDFQYHSPDKETGIQ